MKTPSIKIIVAFAVSSVAACSAPVRPAPKPEVAALKTTAAKVTDGKWYLASEDPVTFHPEGMPKDSGTSYVDGEWVYAGELNAKWFIPNRGAGRRTKPELITDALSMRTKAQRRKLASEDRADFAKHSVQTTAVVASLPVILPAFLIWDSFNPSSL